MTLVVSRWKGIHERLEERHAARAKAMKEWTKQVPPDAKRPNQGEFMAGVAVKMEEFPPEPWYMPDGTLVEISPWLAHLQYLKAGTANNAKNAMHRLETYLNEEPSDEGERMVE